jgi:hypothetical protein
MNKGVPLSSLAKSKRHQAVRQWVNLSFPTYAQAGRFLMNRPDVDIGMMLPRMGCPLSMYRFGSKLTRKRAFGLAR